MKKAVKRILIGLAGVLALLLAVAPFLLPPLVNGFAEAKCSALGFPTCVRTHFRYIWRKGPELAGSLSLSLTDSPWHAEADFGVGLGEWHARLRVPRTEFSQDDSVVDKLLAHYPLKGVSNLAFTASVSLEASVERTRRLPVPVWSVKAPVRVTDAQLVKDEKPLSFEGFAASLGASGIASHLDIAPIFLRMSSASVDGFTLTNLTASIRATEKSLLVTEAKADLCGGRVGVYALFLNPQTMSSGFTVFMDDIDAGDILSHFKGFRGEASGKLYGKLRLFLKDGGKSIRFSDAFLYSTPGETGKLKMSDAGVVTENLALAGIDEGTRSNVAEALSNLDYTVLKLDLRRVSGTAAKLSVRLDGTATRDNRTVPVNLNLNFNGDIEQIVNTGLGFSNRLKGKKK